MRTRPVAIALAGAALAIIASGCSRSAIIYPVQVPATAPAQTEQAAQPQAGATQSQIGVAPSRAEAVQPYASGQKIVFDMGHSEIFGVDDTTQLGQSRAVERMRATGFDVIVNSDTITAKDLQGASGLILAGPMRPLLAEEYSAINKFISDGGTMLLTIHVPYPVMSVPGHWSLPAVPSVVMGAQPLPGEKDPGVLLANQIKSDRLTEGVKQILVVSGWPIQPSSQNAKVVVSTDSSSWIDADNNKTLSKGEKRSYGIIGTAGLGKGRVIVLGDDAIFANIAIDKVDNMKLLDNVLRIMAKGLQS